MDASSFNVLVATARSLDTICTLLETLDRGPMWRRFDLGYLNRPTREIEQLTDIKSAMKSLNGIPQASIRKLIVGKEWGDVSSFSCY
jgi:hypothetical protein